MTSRTTEPLVAAALAENAGGLLCAAAVRNSAHRMLVLALDGGLSDWSVHPGRLEPTADFVAAVVRDRYPRLDVPVHSRWRHFVFQGRDLWSEIAARAAWTSPAAAARGAIDLVILSVLLDAGAGSGWQYQDRATGLAAARSEGLALASLRWFEQGGLSDHPAEALRVDTAALRRTDPGALSHAFQVREDNPLLGLEGRAALLNRLGTVLESRPDLFAIGDSPRPGGLFDALRARASNGRVAAATVLQILLEALGPVWQARPSLGGVPLGDCWPHPALATGQVADGYVPLHKLSQWLAYSLIEPLGSAGISVTNIHELTGLAEYRNGGLFVDMGVLTPRDGSAFSRTYEVGDPFVVGWRALTIALLDRLAPLVSARLGLSQESFPLARVLEGGTWAAGRLIARERRTDGGPPFQVLSDGTVF